MALFAAVCFGLGLQHALMAELRGRNVETDSAPHIVAEAMVKVVSPFAFWAWLGRHRWGARERVLAVWTGVFLAVMLATQTAGLMR